MNMKKVLRYIEEINELSKEYNGIRIPAIEIYMSKEEATKEEAQSFSSNLKELGYEVSFEELPSSYYMRYSVD